MKNEDVPKKNGCGRLYDFSDVWPKLLRKTWPWKNASHAESSHTRSAPRKHDREKNRERKNVTNFFQMSGLSSYPLRHFDSFLRIMSIIIRSYTPFLGMIPQKLLTNLEESPWNLSENLRKVLVLLPVFVQSSCGHANIVIPPTKLEVKDVPVTMT